MSYSNSRLGTNKSTSIALPTGIYDVKIKVFRNWFNWNVGRTKQLLEKLMFILLMMKRLFQAMAMNGYI